MATGEVETLGEVPGMPVKAALVSGHEAKNETSKALGTHGIPWAA